MRKQTGTDQFIEIAKASVRIAKYLKPTPLQLSGSFSDESTKVFYKLENLQPTGSFKIRGAANKLLSMSEVDRSQGVVTASTGNHGAGVGLMCRQLNCQGIVFAPETTPQTKLHNMASLGLKIIKKGNDGIICENAARNYAVENNMPFISPYNDPFIVAGQGTIGFELYSESDDLDAVFVSLGGGGLTSGIAIALANLSRKTKIIACSATNSKVMMQSISAGQILDLDSEPTLSDGTAGGVEQGSITFDYCRDYVDEFIEVSEEEIILGMKQFIGDTHFIGEGAVGVAVGGFLQQQSKWIGKKIVIIACGGNVNSDVIKSIL
jgi:threonine dehydratase